WGKVQPSASERNAFLKSHTWEEYARWHLGLTDGASDHAKARYAFIYGDFRRVHRMGIIACHYRAAEWRHKEIELAAHELLQYLDNKPPRTRAPAAEAAPRRGARPRVPMLARGGHPPARPPRDHGMAVPGWPPTP